MSDTVANLGNAPSTVSKSKGGFFSFRTMISPKIIKILHAIGLAVIIITGVVLTSQGLDYYRTYLGIGLALLILGPFVWRIFCEAWILAFSIHEALVSIDNKLDNR